MSSVAAETPYWLTLNKITKDEYFAKCNSLCSQFAERNMNRDPPILQAANQKDWKSLVSAAEKMQGPLREFMENVQQTVGTDTVEVHQAPVKGVERASEKVEMDYDGNWRRLLDVCRGGIVHESYQELARILTLLLEHHDNVFGFKVVRCKNRYSNPTQHGWADIHLLLVVSVTKPWEGALKAEAEDDGKSEENAMTKYQNRYAAYPPHICEVQLSHIEMWNKRKESKLFGHGQYKVCFDFTWYVLRNEI